MIKDRRKKHRVDISFPVECVTLPERKKIFYTVSKDLSPEGLKILSENFIAYGKTVKVSINLVNEMAEVKAKIIWCNKKPYSEKYYAGLKFLEVDGANKRNLALFISKIKQS